MFTLQISFKPLLLGGGGGEGGAGIKSVLLVKVTVNSKEENSYYFGTYRKYV
jgi:hypothetical protein